AAPGIDAGEGDALAGIELTADRGIHAVAGDGDGAAHRRSLAPRRCLAKSDTHPVRIQLHADALAIVHDALRAETLDRRVEQHAMQLAAMDAQLGIFVARVAPARLLVDELAVPVEEGALLVLDRHLAQALLQAERRQLAHAVGQQRDADAELAYLLRRLVDAARDAALLQREREGEAGDAPAD